MVLATGAKWVLPAEQGLSEAQASGFAVTIDQAMSREKPFDPGAAPVIFGAAIGVIKLSWHNDRVRTLHHRLSADYHQFKKPKIVEHWKRAVLIAAMSL